MYIQITTNCNMSCGHCIFGCASHKKGSNMSFPMFKKAIRISEIIQHKASIGGGEPTIHPDFWKFLGYALESDAPSVWMATNGKKTDRTKALLKMAPTSLQLVLSQDQWHDPIDADVVSEFIARGLEIRTNTRISKNGSAIENEVYNTNDCECGGFFIAVSGDVKPCACEDSPVLFNIMDNPSDDILRKVCEIGYSVGCYIHWTDEQLDSVTLDNIAIKEVQNG